MYKRSKKWEWKCLVSDDILDNVNLALSCNYFSLIYHNQEYVLHISFIGRKYGHSVYCLSMNTIFIGKDIPRVESFKYNSYMMLF